MADDIHIELDTSEADQRTVNLAKWLSPGQVARAGASALNRALRAGVTEGSRAIRDQLRVKARAVRDRIDTERATPANLVAVINFDYTPLPLKEFGRPYQTRQGVKVTITKGGGRVLIPDSFISPDIGGHVVRRAKEGDGLVPRTPVHILPGPSIGSQLEDARPRIEARTNEVMQERIAHELEWRAERANR